MRKDIKPKKKSNLLNIFLFILLIAILIILGYLYYKKVFFKEIAPTSNTQEEETIVLEEKEPIAKEEKEKEPEEEPTYTEQTPVIEGQQAYIVAPNNISLNEPATIVIYSHGSTGTITDNLSEDFMSELREFALQFPPHNYIFAASNQHGDNEGNPESIQDTLNMISWVRKRYPIKEKYLFIGFSRGALTTMNFVTTYPNLVLKIALLAPTLRLDEWNPERFPKIKDLDIKIWHGTDDINVRFSKTISFLETAAEYDITIPLVRLEGKTHFDIDREYVQEIIEFFNP